MELQGEIIRIIYNNVNSGYSVLEIVQDERVYTVVGTFPPVSVGQIVKVSGTFKNVQQYGKQLVADKAEILPPSKVSGIIKFLSSGLIKGLGPVTANAIVQKYGVDTLEKMKYPVEIAKVNGISLKRAVEFCASFATLQKMQEAIIFLQNLGITINTSLKIYKIYEKKTVDTVTNNPYTLIYDVDGIGFATADSIAAKLGIDRNSNYRICAAIDYLLKDAATRNGHNYLPKDELISATTELLQLDCDNPEEKIVNNLEEMVLFGRLVTYDTGDCTAVMRKKNYMTELNIANKLLGLKLTVPKLKVDAMTEVKRFERQSDITLHENQVKAVRDAVENGVQIVTGGPGTGKTTIVRCMLDTFRNLNQSVALCAPTGRAAKRLSAATGAQAKTIHRLLGLDWKDGTGVFAYNDETKLPFDVIIVDEVSMVDEMVFSALLSAMKTGSRLILVGDKDQLASVGAGNVLNDLIRCGYFPVSYLTQIYRQSEKSKIVPNAHKINDGLMPDIDNKSDDFFFEEIEDSEEICKDTIGLVTRRLPKFLNMAPIDIQVLCPMKKGLAGVVNLNRELQSKVNPPTPNKKEFKRGDCIFREGDKVMQTQNNYQMEWSLYNGRTTESGVGVFNGDIGIVEEVNLQQMTLKVRFDDDKVAIYAFSDADQLSLAYAVTIHKSQGCEFDAVVIALDANYMLQTRNLIYTAVTRAKRLVVIVGKKAVLSRMVKNNETEKRYSLLTNLLDDAVKSGRYGGVE